MSPETIKTLTIGRLAKAAGIGIETVRYYQQRKLLPIPRRIGAYRQYPTELIGRIRFIKRAQELGFTLDEIASLLDLSDGAARENIRAIASQRIEQIKVKLADLNRMRQVLDRLVQECEHSHASQPCPIIESLIVGSSKDH
jgi:MerR family mercuric resistance operon transcriptional regulator